MIMDRSARSSAPWLSISEKKEWWHSNSCFFSSRFSPKKSDLNVKQLLVFMASDIPRLVLLENRAGLFHIQRATQLGFFRGSWDTFLQSTPICLTFQNWNFQVASTRKHVWGGFHDFHNFGIFLNGWCWLPSRCSLRQNAKIMAVLFWGGRMEDGSLPLRPCNWPLQETGMMKRRC